MKQVKENDDEAYTFEEYKKKFRPPKAEGQEVFDDDPLEIGIALAEESLRQIRQTFRQKQSH